MSRPSKGAPTEAPALDHYRRLLHGRAFRLWFGAALSAGLADWLGLFALQVLVVSLAEPGSQVALYSLGGIMIARIVPSVLFGAPAGVLADRLDRKHLLVFSNVARAGLFIAIAFTRELWLLFALVLVVELTTILFVSTKNALLPHIVEERDLTEANQLTLLVSYGPLPFGAAVAALLSWIAGLLPRIGLGDVEPVVFTMLLNAVVFVIAATFVARMPLADEDRRSPAGHAAENGEQDAEQVKGSFAQIREGLHHVAERPIIRSLIVGVVATFFGAGAVIALGPEFVRSELGRPGEDWFGLMTSVGIGLLIGMGVATVGSQRFPRERLFAAALVPTPLLVVAIALLPSFRLVQAAGFVLALGAGLSFVLGFTILQLRTPDELRGRTFSVIYIAARVAMVAALALAPFLAGAIGDGELALAGVAIPYSGIRLVMLLGGAVALAGALPSAIGMVRATADEAEDGAAGRDAEDRDRPDGAPDEDPMVEDERAGQSG